jgi:hypothetical protein
MKELVFRLFQRFGFLVPEQEIVIPHVTGSPSHESFVYSVSQRAQKVAILYGKQASCQAGLLDKKVLSLLGF